MADPETLTYHNKWKICEHRFSMKLTPKEAAWKLEGLGYRFLTPNEKRLAEDFIFQELRTINLSFGFLFLDHPIIVLIRPENTHILYVLGVDKGYLPRPLRGLYEHIELEKESGWLVMCEDLPNR